MEMEELSIHASKNIIEITDNIKDISEVATGFIADAIVTKENIINKILELKCVFLFLGGRL